jgi:uncharacterized membrane protein YeaQ/YmgE (transglycosylase-associated protein family)
VAYLTPQTGQFLSVDAKVAQTLEAYLYAGDDPVNRIDPSGQAVFMQCATKTGPSEVACDLGRLASIDFPGISATHIVSIVSAGLLGIVPGVPAAAWHAGRSPGGALSKVASVIIGGIVGAAGAGYWAFRNGNTYSAAQFLSDMKGAELTIFLDEYPKGVSGVGNFNTWLDATIGDSQAFQVYESAILSKVIITGDLSGLLLKLSSKALGNL